eukprot:Skav224603  [mRNA]  locus=scaffold2684:365523:366050:- [translate_table: standard]
MEGPGRSGIELQQVEKVLEGVRSECGEDHQLTLSCKKSLADVLKEEGRLQEAGKMYREVLEGWPRVLEGMGRDLGENHEVTLRCKSNCAVFLQEQGKWQEAEDMQIEVLEERRRVLGKAHQNTLSSKNNLAKVHQERRMWQEAEKMYIDEQLEVVPPGIPTRNLGVVVGCLFGIW